MKKVLLSIAAFGAGAVLLLVPAGLSFADTVGPINFESPTYTVGDINGQNGWSALGAAGEGCAVYDEGVSNNSTIPTAPAGFGAQSFRISDAVTSGCFGDQAFSEPLVNAAGETTASTSVFASGTIQPHFEAQFEIFPIAPGSGDSMSVSPDRGDGSRMSYLRFQDDADGVDVFFDDVTDPGHVTNGDTFNETEIATLSTSTPHTIKFSMDFLNGPDNDIVKIYIDGVLVHTGTSWEDYYLYDTESNPGLADEQSRVVRTLLFREGGTANPSDAAKGFLIDNLSLESGAIPSSSNTTVVTPGNMQGWAFVNDQTEGAGTGMMVTGPGTPPLGSGSAQLTATSTTDGQILAVASSTYAGVKLSSLTTLSYATYQSPANPSNAQAVALQFDVNPDVTAATHPYDGRIVYEPYNNNGGTVPLGTWTTWDALNGGNAKWWFSKPSAFGGNCPQSSPCTLSQIIALYPNIGIWTDGAVVLKAGSGWTSFSGNVDDLTIGIDDNNTTYDFDPNPLVPSVMTDPATAITASNATLNGTNGPVAAGQESFWVSTSTFPTTSPNIPANVYSTPVLPGVAANASFSDPLSFVTTNGIVTGGNPGNMPAITPNTTYYFVAWANVNGTWYPGAELNFSTSPGPDVTVTIDKYIDGKMATAASANGKAFPMVSSWNAANIGSGSGSYTLSTTGFNSPNPYEAVTSPMSSGASYATNEVTTSNTVVGATCAAGGPYALTGYSWGTSTSSAAAMTPSATSPSFTNITQNEYVIVWNKNCLPAPTPLSPPNGTSTTTAGLTSVTWSAVTDPAGGITYVYQSSNSSAQNADGSFTTPAYTSGPLTATNIPTPGTPPGNYWWHVQAKDADGNVSPWSTVWTFTVTAPITPPLTAACNTPTSAPAGYTLKNGTAGNASVTLAPMTMFVGAAGNPKLSGPAGNYILCLAAGNATVTLGDGSDVITTGNGNQNITVGSGGAGSSNITVGNGNSVIKSTDSGNQTVTAGNGNQTITTGSGNDTIKAGNGNSTINAGPGTDSCTVGAGKSVLTSCNP